MSATNQEVRLLFFGTFFHENTELTADLIQLKQPVKVTEIRVIPLGATVDLSTGAFQLGATNPSEFDVEFYYNDLQVPSKTTFELLRRFDFNDKAHIQLVCESSEEIITDGLLVRGIYSTVTLAVYGHAVDEVPIREVEIPKKESIPSPALSITSSPPATVDSPEPLKIDLGDTADDFPSVECKPSVPVSMEIESSPSSTVGASSHAIPTITTRVNYDAVSTSVDECEEQGSELLVADSDVISENNEESETMSEVGLAPVTELIPEVMDTEEISDEDVFPSEDEEEDKSKPLEHAIEKAAYIDPLIELAEPISSPQEQNSDMEDSFLDESSEAGFEEIISDEEIDFPEYDYGEWEENWAHKLMSRPFNPFSDSFEVLPLNNIVVTSGLLVEKTSEECMTLLMKKCRSWSPEFSSSLLERWVEDMEKLLPFIPTAFCSPQEAMSPGQPDLESLLMYWIKIGTNFKLAMEQPTLAFKVRHLKVGIKLVQCIANVEGGISNLLMGIKFVHSPIDGESTIVEHNGSIQHHLIDLLLTPHMSNSCKLLILRTLDATISSKCGYSAFTSSVSSVSSYQRLIEYSLDSSFSTRMSFSLRSVLNKLRLMEGLEKLDIFVNMYANNAYPSASESNPLSVIEDLCVTAHHISEYFSLPLKVLPAKAVVDFTAMSSSGHDPKVSFVRMLKEMRFLQMATVLVNVKETEVSYTVLNQITELLTVLLGWEAGLVYLSNEGSSTTILIKSLLQMDDDAAGTACLIAHCMELMQCIDVLSKSIGECTENVDLQCLQTSVSFLTTSVGREAILKTLAQGNFLVPFLNCVWPSESEPDERSRSDLGSSVHRGYAIEVLDFFFRSCDSVEVLKKHGLAIWKFMSSSIETGDENNKLLKNQSFFKPVINPSVFTLDGLDIVCEIIKNSKLNLLQSRGVGCNYGFPGEMTTCFRILLHLVKGDDDSDLTRTLLSQTDELRVRVLKHDLAITKIHCNDLLSTMTGILQKIGTEFTQPTLHSHIFVSSTGDALLGLLLPVVRVLRKCITLVVQVRKTGYRDTTMVAVLLQIYRLLSFFPATSISYAKSQEVSSDVVGILLIFTLPVVKLGSETEDELNKSTWTAVVSETIKFILEEPSNFQAGLTLLSELLPLPLPIASKSDLSDETCEEAIRLRRLWSAYIHGLSSQMHEMIGILCTSTNPKLLHLLKRVCIQLADLSVSTCLVVCRAILDNYLISLDADSELQPLDLPSTVQPNSVKAWVDTAKSHDERQCSSYTARVLGFLASLMNNCPTIKCGVMHALKGTVKIDEKYCDVLNFMCSILLARPTNTLSSSHMQAQDNVVTIFQSLCDVEINMIIPMFGKRSKAFEPEFVLACSLPPKEHLVAMGSALVSYLDVFELKSMQVVEGALRTLEIIAETDFGLSVISTHFIKNRGLLEKVAASILSFVNNIESFESSLPCIMSYLDLLKSITTTRTQQIGNFPIRLRTISNKDLRHLFNWKSESFSQELGILEPVDPSQTDEATSESKDVKGPSGKNSLCHMKQVFEDMLKIFKDSPNTSGSLELTDFESALQIIDQLIHKMSENCQSNEESASIDNYLQFHEGLPELFNIRPIYVLVDKTGNNDNLPAFWLTSVPPAFEVDCDTEESDLVAVDLEELSKSHLNGFDISKEIQNMAKTSELQSSDTAISKNENAHPSFRGGNHGRRLPQMHALNLLHRRSNFSNSMRGGGRGMFSRGMSAGGRNYDPFRSRPPNTSRPPSLHVDDFVMMEGQSSSPQLRNAGGGGGDQYSSRGNRGGAMNSFGQDRRRIPVGGGRPGTPAGNFYHANNNKRHDSPAPSARTVRGGRIFSTPNSDRWTADSRNSSSSLSLAQQSYDRNARTGNYDDKYRSSPGGGSTRAIGTSSLRTQPYPQRSLSSSGGYREGRKNTGSPNYPARWRDRQSSKTFNNR